MSIEAVNLEMLRSALDLASLRQQVITANIANASTPGYARQKLSFEDHLLAQAEGRGLPRSGGVDAASFRNELRLTPDLGPDGQPRAVQLDEEVAAMTQNSLHYQALMRAVAKHYSVLHSAATEGRR